jgi:hypothetical protein
MVTVATDSLYTDIIALEGYFEIRISVDKHGMRLKNSGNTT